MPPLQAREPRPYGRCWAWQTMTSLELQRKNSRQFAPFADHLKRHSRSIVDEENEKIDCCARAGTADSVASHHARRGCAGAGAAAGGPCARGGRRAAEADTDASERR